MNNLIRTVLLLALFSIAMGFMESAVVIYLRELYYPNGFRFPLAQIPTNIALVEFLREAATIIMLAIIGIIAGRNLTERFSFFLFCFAVWDLFYYVFLKVFLGWPESMFTWDILFLIPIPWVGPVIAPCIISLTMILLALVVVYFHQSDVRIKISRVEWLLLIAGEILQIVSFTIDYMRIVSQNNKPLWKPLAKENLFADISNYVPRAFPWGVFIFGELLILMAILLIIKRQINNR